MKSSKLNKVGAAAVALTLLAYNFKLAATDTLVMLWIIAGVIYLMWNKTACFFVAAATLLFLTGSLLIYGLRFGLLVGLLLGFVGFVLGMVIMELTSD